MIYIFKLEVQKLDSPGNNPMHNDRRVHDLAEFRIQGADFDDCKERFIKALELVQPE